MQNALHKLAIRFGWYKDVTYGLPLNVCKTVFGTYFLEGVYTPEPVGKLVEDMYRWGCRDGMNSVIPEKPYKTEWKTRKDGKARYRKVATKTVTTIWCTESEPLNTP